MPTDHLYARGMIPRCCDICSQVPEAHPEVAAELATFADPDDDLDNDADEG